MKSSVQMVIRINDKKSVALQGRGPLVCGQRTLDDLMRFIHAVPMANRPPESFLGFDRFTTESASPGNPAKLKLDRASGKVDGLRLVDHASIEPADANFIWYQGQWFYGRASIVNVYALSSLLTLADNAQYAPIRRDAATGDQS